MQLIDLQSTRLVIVEPMEQRLYFLLSLQGQVTLKVLDLCLSLKSFIQPVLDYERPQHFALSFSFPPTHHLLGILLFQTKYSKSAFGLVILHRSSHE